MIGHLWTGAVFAYFLYIFFPRQERDVDFDSYFTPPDDEHRPGCDDCQDPDYMRDRWIAEDLERTA